MGSLSGLSVIGTTLALAGCSSAPVYENPYKPSAPNSGPELAKISSITPSEMTQYGGIMTKHQKDTDKILSTCHFARVHIPTSENVRKNFESRTGKKWMATGGDTYTVTARHCVDDSMGRTRMDGTIDVVAIRSLNRLFENDNRTFKSLDKPPVLERSPYDEKTIGNMPLVLRACIPHVSNDKSYCFKLEGRSYSEGIYGQRHIYYRLSDIIPLLTQAGRTCANSPNISGVSGMVLTENGRAYGFVSTGVNVCNIYKSGGTNGSLSLEPLRNTGNSLPGQPGKTLIISN